MVLTFHCLNVFPIQFSAPTFLMVDAVCKGEYLVVGIEARRIPDLGEANIPGLKHFAIPDLHTV